MLIDTLSGFFGGVFWLIVALGLLVTFHEYGHFWVARRCGVKVLTFSVGFGNAIWSRLGRDGVRYQIAALPLGGYVKMLDEREAPVDSSERHLAFNHQPLGQRAAIVAAGPIANLIFAFLAFWLMFLVGVADVRPVLGETDGLAAQAGLQLEDEIVAIDGSPTPTWTHTMLELLPAALDQRVVVAEVHNMDGAPRTVALDLSQLDDFEESEILDAIGLQPWSPVLAPVIGSIGEGTAAAEVDLRAGDRVTTIGDQTIERWDDISDAVAGQRDRASGEIALVIERNGMHREVRVVPREVQTDRGSAYQIGIRVEVPAEVQAQVDRTFTMRRYGPVAAAGQAVLEGWSYTVGSMAMLTRMVTGKASLDNLSGPITIGRVARDSAALGFSSFLRLLAILSLSLAILNLLPIPLLDGGHLAYFAIEAVKGSPVSERVQILGQYIGLAALAMLMSLVFYNDIIRLL